MDAHSGIRAHALWRAQNAPGAGSPGSVGSDSPTSRIVVPNPALLWKAKDLVVAAPAPPSTTRAGSPGVAAGGAQRRDVHSDTASMSVASPCDSSPRYARAVPQTASVVLLAAPLHGPSPAPFSSGSNKTGEITRDRNRTDQPRAYPPCPRTSRMIPSSLWARRQPLRWLKHGDEQ
jgi:hypothetical protein